MQRLLFICIGFFLLYYAQAQPDSTYQRLIAKAGLFHLQKDYRNAIKYYEEGFRLCKPDALTAYKAAGVYALENNCDKAFYFLQIAIKGGWAEADVLASDPYFINLKRTDPIKWKQIIQHAVVAERQFEHKLTNPALRKNLNLMGLNEQRLRYKRIQAKNKQEEGSINREIYAVDSANQVYAKAIINEYGWPKISEIGKDGQNNLWLVIQHADNDIELQRSALSAMQQLKGAKELNLENYAFLYDRVQCNLNYKQLYGTQVNWTTHGEAGSFKSILNEDAVDMRRKTMGLLPLKIYALSYGFAYKNISVLQALKKDSSERASTKILVDSAKYYFGINAFQRVYDYYNEASLIAGGMSNDENYEAAKLFAIIASRDQNPQYKSISLDFLNLLYLRKELNRQLLADKVFQVLYDDPRWTAVLK
jgi:hypothetical protein